MLSYSKLNLAWPATIILVHTQIVHVLVSLLGIDCQCYKAQYTRCDLVVYDLVASYGIESSSILYDMLYAMHDCASL